METFYIMQNNIFLEFWEKLKLARRVKACNVIDEIKLIFTVIKFSLNNRNSNIETVVDVDGIKYKLVDVESLIILSPRYEEWMWKYLTPKEGDYFVDVGAHVGKYALRVAKIVGDDGKVIAIEPELESFRALVKGIMVNKLTNIIPVNVAAWDKETRLVLYVGEDNAKSRYLVGKGWSSVKRKVSELCVEVPAKSLDNIIKELKIDRVDFIKIDAEGSEYEVLKGSQKIIKSCKPRMIIESTSSPSKLQTFMKKLGVKYRLELAAENHLYFEPT